MIEDLDHKIAVLEAINRLNVKFRTVASAQEAYEAIAEELRTATGADFSVVGLIEKGARTIRLAAFSGVAKPDWSRLPEVAVDERFRKDLALVGETRAVRFSSQETAPEVARPIARALDVGDSIFCTILMRGGVIGYLSVAKRKGDPPFPAHAEQTLVTISNNVAMAIDNMKTSMELSQTKEATEKILSLAPIIIFTLDPNGIFKSVNKEMLRMLGETSEDKLVGTSVFEVQAITKSGLDNLIMEGMKGHEGERTDVHFVPRPDRTAYLHAKVTPIRRESGDIEGVLFVAMDVTSKIRLQHQLERSYEKLTQTYSELERVNKMKSTFIDVVSHELRTPLTVMRGYIDLLESQGLDGGDPKFASRTKILKANTDKLYGLVESMLDVSRLEKGSIEIHPEPVALDAILQAVAEGKRPMAEEKRQSIVLDIDGKLPLIMGDRRRLKDVFDNLVDNAIKYTQETGRIQVGARDEGKTIHAWVKDNGVGIPLENLGRIFERFYIVASHDLAHPVNRLGLGLPISKGIIEGHGGRLWVESQVGKGSVFHVNLLKTSPK